MNVLLALFRYFPHGGMQRDMVATARALQRRGHTVRVCCHTLDGPAPPGLDIEVLPTTGRTNHGRARSFSRELLERIRRQRADCVLGFDKMPHLDLYFAADPCYVARTRSRPWLYRLTPRYRTFRALERSVFGEGGAHVLLLSEPERARYQEVYGTPDERFVPLPPGVDRDRCPGDDTTERRARCRAHFGLTDDRFVLLMVATNYALKGLDRVLDGVRALPDALRQSVHVLAVGEGPSPRWTREVERRGLGDQCTLEAGRDDVPDLLQAADLLVHPAVRDNTGTVLVEALVAGLPAICTSTCGYAEHIAAAKAGVVVPPRADDGPDDPFVDALQTMMRADRERLRAAALGYAEGVDLHGMHGCIVDAIERLAEGYPAEPEPE